jgi:hypothetical protein
VIIVIIALFVACGYEYDFEYDWSRSRSSSPPKKEEVIPKTQVVPKHKLSLEIPNCLMVVINIDSQDDDKDDFFVINDDHYRPSFIQETYGNVPEGGL